MAQNYILRVTAGTEYDPATHKQVAVNTAAPLELKSGEMDFLLNVRIQDYRGLPRSSPASSPYFSLPPHASAGDQYSIALRFRPSASINGDDLVFGNDFDHPIRDRLPPGFGTAFRIVKWVVDPGLDGDVYAEKPYLYGPLGSSLNTFVVGAKNGEEVQADKEKGEGEVVGKAEVDKEVGILIDEGGSAGGWQQREEKGVPETDAARKKWFLDEGNRESWEYEAGREYWGDFFNPYLDFNDFALRLPGFTLPIMKYWDGQGLRKEQKRSHTLRYVLKNRKTGTVYLVVLFTLFLKEDVNEDGSIKEGVEGGKLLGTPPKGVEGHIDEKKIEKTSLPAPVEETSADDVD